MKISYNKISLLLIVMIGSLALLGQFGRTLTPFGFVSWYEVGMLLFVGGFAAQIIKGSFQYIKKYWTVVAFILWATIITIVQSVVQEQPEMITIGGAYLARLMFYLLFAGSVGVAVKKRYLESTILLKLVILWLSLFAGLGILQFLLQPDTRIFFYLGWDDHLSRAFATLFDPGYFGLLMVSGVLFVLWQATKTKLFWHQIALALFLMSTALSYSRASYVALCFGVPVLAFLARSKRIMLVLPLLIMALVLLPKDGGGVGQNLMRTQTLAMRQEVAQKQTESTTWQDMIWGRGWYYQKAQSLDNPQAIQRQNSAGIDNIFLLVFLSTGVIGLTFFILALWQLWYTSNNVFWKSFFAATLAHSFFSLGLFYPWVMLVLAITFFLGEKPSSNYK